MFDVSSTVLLTEGSAAEVLIPTDDTLGLTWTEPGFIADGSWITESSPGVPTATGVGFDIGIGVTSPDLVAAWSLDEDVGSTTVLDSTGGGHNGAKVGAVTFGTSGATATTSTAATFAGSGVIDIPFDAALNPESFTVTAWAKLTGGSGYRSVITSRYDGDVFGGGNLDGFIIYATAGNQWEFWTGDGESQADSWDILPGPPVELNEWTHLAISFDADSSTKTFYVNGAQAATATRSATKRLASPPTSTNWSLATTCLRSRASIARPATTISSFFQNSKRSPRRCWARRSDIS